MSVICDHARIQQDYSKSSVQEFFEDLEHATKPREHRKPLQQGGPGGVPIGALRPLLSNARVKLRAVRRPLYDETHTWPLSSLLYDL